MACWVDRIFFALLGGVSLYLICRNLILSCLLFLGLMMVFVLWDNRRWAKYKRDLWQKTVKTLKREAWLRQEAETIRQAKGTVLYPTPDAETFTGLCLRLGKGTSFHCFGEPQNVLIEEAAVFGCSLTFHPWQEGPEPSREQVTERLRRDAPKRDRKLWQALLHMPDSRYLLTGCILLGLSMVLRRAIYWRLLGSLCLVVGAVRRVFHMPLKA